MRKSLLSIGLFAIIIAFAACCGKGGDKQEEAQGCPSAEECKAKAEFADKWAKFDSLDVEVQKELIAKRVECYKKHLEKCAEKKAECAEKKEHSCKENAEMTEEQKQECIAKKEKIAAKKAELAETWANFENLGLPAQKAFFDEFDALKAMKGCKKDGEKCCKKDGDTTKCCKKDGEKKCGKDAEHKCSGKH